MWIAQRASAAVLALVVIIHLATVVYAVRGDLTAAEIITRVQGNVAWLCFYVIFVLAAAIHAPIGLRTILLESTPLSPRMADVLSAAVLLTILIMGLRTAFGLYGLQT
jgi:fumarate reductase subunit C